MPVSERTIIDAGQVDSKAPIKKSTVAWVLGVVMTLAMIGYYAPKMVTTTKSEEPPSNPATKNAGTTTQIEAELAAPIKDTSPPLLTIPPQVLTPVASAAHGTGGSATTSPVPHEVAAAAAIEAAANARRSESNTPNSGNSRVKTQPKDDIAIEIDSAARVSKSLAVDYNDSPNVSVKATVGQGSLAQATAVAEGLQVDASSSLQKVADMVRGQVNPTGSAADRTWLKEYADLKPTPTITPKKVSSSYTLLQGKVIPSVLGKSLNSDLPGDITAFTTIDIYDSLTSRHLLIPKGSMLIGEYSSNVRAGQSRLMFAFSRILLPNGLSFDLPGNKGQDQMGASGLEGNVNNHYFSRFATGFLVAVLADKTETKSTQTVTGTSTTTTTSAAGQVLAEIAKSDLDKNREIAPTITIPQGTRINVQVSADMAFPGEYRGLK